MKQKYMLDIQKSIKCWKISDQATSVEREAAVVLAEGPFIKLEKERLAWEAAKCTKRKEFLCQNEPATN